MPKLITQEEYLSKKEDKINEAKKLERKIIVLKEEFDNVKTKKTLGNLETEIDNI
jgi:hypothetical protein